MGRRVDFETMEWVEPGPGVRYKIFREGTHQVRLLEFTEGFIEPDWCRHGHLAYVLEGQFAIDYCGEKETYRAGDTVFIPQGEVDKHKALLGPGDRVLLLIYDMI